VGNRIKSMLRKKINTITDNDKLLKTLEDVHAQLKNERNFFMKLSDTMPNRLKLVIENCDM